MASDLSSKYQKLSQEYQKARAQVAVLKKAVLDEQSTNRTCQDTIKQKDQSIRRYEQEIDSLQFRNDQLSKRVEILQAELDDMERKGTKAKGGTEHRSAEEIKDSVKDEELLMKIKENELLHQKLSEAVQQHQVVVQRLEDRLAFLEKERENHEKVVEEANSRYSRVIERLQEDRTFMEGKAKKQEEDLKIANIMVDKYQQQLKGVHKDLNDKLEKATILLRQKLPFNDTEHKQWNILNVPVCDRSYQTHARTLVSNFSGALTTFVSGLCDFLSHMAQWILFHASDVKREEPTLLSVKLTSHLNGKASVIQEVSTALSKFSEFAQKEFLLSLETCTPLQDVSKAFTKLTQYLRKILPYFLICMAEETEFPDCPEQLENLTKDFAKSFAKTVGNVQRLDRYLALISTFAANPSLKNTSGTCFKHMHSHLKKLSGSCEDLCTFYYLKSEEEQKLPTVTERLINADKSILKALTSLSSTSMKMLNFFDANVDFISRASGFKRKGFAPDEEQGLTSAVKHFQAKARNYMEGLQKDTEESIPHAVAVHNYRTLVTSTESRETLAQQVLNSQETLSKLEQEKEHWMLEAQLLKVKYEKETKRVAILGEELKKARSDAEQRFSGVQVEDLEENVEKPVGSGTTPRSPSIASVSSGQESLIAFPQVGTVDVVSNEKEKTTEDTHETMMKDHLTARISGLTRQAQQADSKAVSFYAECRALYKQLVLADKSKKRVENELTQAHKGIEELQDVLETTKRSYEEQLRTLSDHLCGMNEQLTSQREKAEASKTPTKSRVGVGLGRKKDK